MKSHADALTVDRIGYVEVVEAADVVDAEYAQDVVETGGDFHIGCVHAHAGCILREDGQVGVRAGTVAVGQATPHAAETDDLS